MPPGAHTSGDGPSISGVLETCIYARDLAAAERFYAGVLGLEVLARQPDRHIFFRCGRGVFLVFDPDATGGPEPAQTGTPVPAHGCRGPGHAAFAVSESEIAGWRARLEGEGVPVEMEVEWPRGGRSLYVRDPAGNSIELATPPIWGLPDPGPATPWSGAAGPGGATHRAPDGGDRSR